MTRTPSTAASRGFLDALIRRFGRGSPIADLEKLAEGLLSGRGEASGVALAHDILDGYAGLDPEARLAFLALLDAKLRRRCAAARPRPIDTYRGRTIATRCARRCTLPPSRAGRNCSAASTSRPAARGAGAHARGPARLPLATSRDLAAVDADFVASVLVVVQPRLPGAAALSTGRRRPASSKRSSATRRCTRSRSWDDLRRRLEPPDRRCFAFFHPALVDEPLIFVEVALTEASRAPSRRCSPPTASRSPPTARRHRGVLFDLQLPARACAASPSAIS